jgi:hypothetical protein
MFYQHSSNFGVTDYFFRVHKGIGIWVVQQKCYKIE